MPQLRRQTHRRQIRRYSGKPSGYARAVGVFVQLETPIAFDAIDNQPVDLLFALLVPADQTKTHLHTLSLVAKRLADKTICRRLRAAQSDEELYQIITDTEGTPDEA